MWVDLGSPDPGTIEDAVRITKEGGVVFYPSDTIYGLGCDPFHIQAVKKLYAIKGRDEGKGVLLLVPDLEWVDRLAAVVSPEAEYLISRFWPGKLTLLFQPSSRVPSSVIGRGGRIGLRLPDSRFLQDWMRSLSGPLVSTSANLSGSAVPQDLGTLREIFYEQVDLFLEAGELSAIAPSTVVDLLGDPKILRGGEGQREVEAALAEFSK
jgi:L-threonylcarbamoyladenylate synthase